MAQGVSRKKTFSKTDGRCAYCGCELDPFNFHREHAIPASRGGPNRAANIVPSCQTCNSRKRSRTVEEFREYIRERPLHLLQHIAQHINKYSDCLNLEKDVIDQINEEAFALYQSLVQLSPTFYMDDLELDLFLGGDLENAHEN